jgi:thiosulfate/3-mercaptopyruvate sulfurtransferase
VSDPVVSTAWLAEHLSDLDVQIVDASWFLPNEGDRGRRAYLEAHIPGAVFFDLDEIADHTTPLPHMLPGPEAFAEAAGALGLRREALVVVYDAQGIFSAPRVWWTLRVMGFPNAAVLDGGLPKWRAEGRPVETGEPPAPPASKLAPEFHPELVRDVAAVSQALTGRAQVVDARPAARFRGEAPEPRPGLRSGHMPGALSLPFGQLLTPAGTLRPPDELRAAFEAAGVDLSRPIVTTCGSGVSAAVLALGLARAGRADAAVYDGSWAEWGRPGDTEVVTGG